MAGRAPAPTIIEGVGTNVTFAYGPGDLVSCPSRLTGTALIKEVKATRRLDRDGATISWIGLRALKRGQILQVESIHSTDPFEVIKAAEQTGNVDPLPDLALKHSRARIEKFTVAELKQLCKKADLDDKGLKPALKQRIFDWLRDNQSKFSDEPPPPPPHVSPPPPPLLNGEDEAGDLEGAATPAPSVAEVSAPEPPSVPAVSAPAPSAAAPSVAAPSVATPHKPPTRSEPLVSVYAALMSQDSDVRVGDIIAAWKINGDRGIQSNLKYGRVVKISEKEIITHPSMSDCTISPESGMRRLRVCARRVPSGPFAVDALPLLFPVDVNDGHCDVPLDRRMGIVSTMTLVQGHDPRWVKLAEAAANARATEHKAHVDGTAFKEADDDGNFPPDLFATINNFN